MLHNDRDAIRLFIQCYEEFRIVDLLDRFVGQLLVCLERANGVLQILSGN